MPRRDGISRRQVPQLQKDLNAGVPITVIVRKYNCIPEVVFNFAKAFDIKLKETPETVALQDVEDRIELEVQKRLAEERAVEKRTTEKELDKGYKNTGEGESSAMAAERKAKEVAKGIEEAAKKK